MAFFEEKILGREQTLFSNEAALDLEFVPKIIPHREGEQRRIVECIKPLLSERTGRNVFIYGPPGVGKTVANKHVLRDLEENSEGVFICYVNCWQADSTHKVVLKICNEIGYMLTQNKNTFELLDVVGKFLNKGACVLVFDEIDKASELDFLYYFLEKVERKTVVLITNYKDEFMERLEPRIVSRLGAEVIEFKPYNLFEMKSIFLDRIKYAFFEEVVSLEVIEMVSKKAFEVGDARAGLFLLREAGRACEERASKKIEKVDFEVALSRLSGFSFKKSEVLSEEAKRVLEMVRNSKGQKKIGDFYKIYLDSGGRVSYKTFQRIIERLSLGGYISTEKVSGAFGRTTMVDTKLSEY